jgi:hypothetical protein
MRRSTSSLDQRAARSAATVCRAPLNVPSGFDARGQIWPLSRWVWRSTKQGQTWPPSSRTAGAPTGAVPAGPIRAIADATTSMSASASPSPSTSSPGTGSPRSAAGMRLPLNQ